jgi:peptide-methionine (R)-S-oxide reductase
MNQFNLNSSILLAVIGLILVRPSQSFASVSRSGKGLFVLSASDDSRSNNIISTSDKDNSTMGTWNPFSLLVLKLGFTEPAWTSSLNYKKSKGIYQCAYCKTPLFSSTAKYDSGSGWPSFWRTIATDRVSIKKEWGGRIECSCAGCGGHLGEQFNDKSPLKVCCVSSFNVFIANLGHVFPDGPTRGSLNQGRIAMLICIVVAFPLS